MALASQAAFRAFEHVASERASVFIAGLLFSNPEDASPAPDLQHELDVLILIGRRAGVTVTGAIDTPPTIEAISDAADSDDVFGMHPSQALHAAATERGVLATTRK